MLSDKLSLQAPHFGQVIEGIDVTHRLLAGHRECSGHYPKSLTEAISRHEAHFSVRTL